MMSPSAILRAPVRDMKCTASVKVNNVLVRPHKNPKSILEIKTNMVNETESSRKSVEADEDCEEAALVTKGFAKGVMGRRKNEHMVYRTV